MLKKQSKVLQNVHKLFSTTSSTNNKKRENYDIVIAGGGTVGFAAALSLKNSRRLKDKSILVIEGQPNKEFFFSNEYSNRVFALNNHTKKLLQKIGAWNNMEKYRVQPVKRMLVWESLSEAMITFDEFESDDSIAHIAENDLILDSIKSKLSSDVKVLYQSRITDYNLPKSLEDDVSITLQDGTNITAKMLIGADGANSPLRKKMGGQHLSCDYNQLAIVATLRLSEEQENFTAWQKFLPTGPVALLPLSSTHSSLVWSTSKEKAKQLLKLEERDFVDALNNCLEDEKRDPLVRQVEENWYKMLRTFSSPSSVKQLPPSIAEIESNSRAAFPLGMGHAVHYVAPRVALIGDAAHRVHPLAGQGVNLGFGDVAALTKILEENVIQGSELGSIDFLYRYEKDRQKHNLASIAAIDGLYRLYGTRWPPFVLMRSLGLSAVDACMPLKKRIMAHAEM